MASAAAVRSSADVRSLSRSQFATPNLFKKSSKTLDPMHNPLLRSAADLEMSSRRGASCPVGTAPRRWLPLSLIRIATCLRPA